MSGRKCTLCGRMESGNPVVASQPRAIVGHQDAGREPFTRPAAGGRPQRPHRTDNHAYPDQPENEGEYIVTNRQVCGLVQPLMRFSIVLHASTSLSRSRASASDIGGAEKKPKSGKQPPPKKKKKKRTGEEDP